MIITSSYLDMDKAVYNKHKVVHKLHFILNFFLSIFFFINGIQHFSYHRKVLESAFWTRTQLVYWYWPSRLAWAYWTLFSNKMHRICREMWQTRRWRWWDWTTNLSKRLLVAIWCIMYVWLLSILHTWYKGMRALHIFVGRWFVHLGDV